MPKSTVVEIPPAEQAQMLAVLRQNDPAFEADVRLVVERPAYDLDERAELPQQLIVAGRARGLEARVTGMTYWTDAAILGAAGIPTVLFGPRGAGLHAPVEYGGQGAPFTLHAVVEEFLCGSNAAFSMYPGLAYGAAEVIAAFGTKEQKDLYLPKIFGGQWDPMLTREQNLAAQRQALIQGGLRTLMASNSGEAHGLGALAAGALGGQEAGAMARQGANGESMQPAPAARDGAGLEAIASRATIADR